MALLKKCFLWPFLLMIIVVSIHGIKASHEVFMKFQSQSAYNVKKIHRTGFHYQPPRHWINGMYFLSNFFYIYIFIILCIIRFEKV